MAAPPIPSALDASTQTFPTLTQAQINRLLPHGKVRKVKLGDILFNLGDTNVPFFVVLSGSLEIVQPDLKGERLIVTHDAHGHFTGELTMISGRRTLVQGRVKAPGEFLEISAEELRSVIAKDAELSEILMRAFILRRLALINAGYGNLILMGSRHSAQTLRLREFLIRNGQPYTYVDLDTDETSQELLDRFHITVDEIPVVICASRSVMRNPSVQELADCLGFNATVDESQVHDVVIVGAGPSGPGIPDGHFRTGTGESCYYAGVEVRRENDDRAQRLELELRSTTLPRCARRRHGAGNEEHRYFQRRAVQQASHRQPGEV